MNIATLKRVFVLTMFLAFSGLAYAEPNGTCWSDPLTNYDFTFTDASFPKNKAGAKTTIKFGGSDSYPLMCAPNPEMLPSNYDKATFGGDVPATGTTLHVSDSLDAIVSVYVSYSAGSHDVPFDIMAGGGVKPPKEGGSIDTTYAQSGHVTFTLTKDAIGGAVVIPAHVVLFKTYRSVYKGVYAVRPVIVGYTAGQIIPVDNVCDINNGATIMVPFGDIDATQLTSDGISAKIKKDYNLNYSCSSSLTQDIDITLVGNSSDFEANALKSSISDVGVEMMHNGKVIPPGGSFNSKLVNGVGGDKITFSPIIRSGAENVQGKFTASATLIMTSA